MTSQETKAPVTRESVMALIKSLMDQEFSITETRAKPLTESSKLIADCGLESLQAIQLIMCLEDEYDLDLPDQDVGLKQQGGLGNNVAPITIGHIIDAVLKHLALKPIPVTPKT